MPLEFRKKSILKGVVCGYYLNNEFLSRIKTDAIAILRERIKDRGHGFNDTEWKNTPEGVVICEEYEKANKKTRKTEEKKKGYYKTLSSEKRQNDIFRMEQKILRHEKMKTERINFFNDYYNERITELRENIVKLKNIVGTS